jgi:hypothetical protein
LTVNHREQNPSASASSVYEFHVVVDDFVIEATSVPQTVYGLDTYSWQCTASNSLECDPQTVYEHPEPELLLEPRTTKANLKPETFDVETSTPEAIETIGMVCVMVK